MSGTWASGWALNDVVTVAEFAKGVGCVADSTLGASAASIDLTGLPTTYSGLLIVYYLRGDTAAATTNVLIRFNNDTAANYYSQQWTAAAATVSASESLASTNGAAGDCPANTALANAFGTGQVWVPHYGQAANRKTWSGSGISPSSTTTGTLTLRGFGGRWDAALAAINRVTLFPAAGNFVTGSRVTVYVMGA